MLALFAGCSDDGPQFADARGTVLLDGKPLAGATVMYSPIAQGPIATGVTDAEGRFSLKTLDRDGAIIGRHRVAITKQEFLGFDESKPKKNALTPIIEWQMPKRYARPETSNLTAEVGSDAGEVTFKLTSGSS